MYVWSKLLNRTVTPFQLIVSYYCIAIALSFGLLRLPFVHQPGVEVDWFDSLFMAVSAVSVTGLTVINVSETYSIYGIIILILILQLGAIGIMAIGTLIWVILGRKIGMKERQLIMIDSNQLTVSGVVHLVLQIVRILVLIEVVGAFILMVHYSRYFNTFEDAMLHGVFTAVSATTNGGFDITGMSMQPYHHDYFIQFICMILVMLGAIGFPVLIEVKQFLKSSSSNFRFSLFTKITTATYALLFLVGAIGIFIIEVFNSMKYMTWHEAIFTALFHSASTRSAGLATVPVTDFNEATHVFMSFLMFIGASPSSVGGGIRTTTFALVVLFLVTFAMGHEKIHVFGRSISQIDVSRAFAVFIVALLLVMVSTMMLLITEPQATLTQILFEITSAFGTCGLSLGITTDLSTIGKVVIMLLMFIGRVGLISFLYSLGGRTRKRKYDYPTERIIIG
ncbi:MAG: TrkH family potassium uptake protein [Caryophanon sp.]|nr:TrkH family potassium uptake protein [Caryophanon sp.]